MGCAGSHRDSCGVPVQCALALRAAGPTLSIFPVNSSMPGTVIRARKLSKVVQSGDSPLTILDDVSFDIAPGERVAIVGAAGSGQTKVLGLLRGVHRPTAGELV